MDRGKENSPRFLVDFSLVKIQAVRPVPSNPFNQSMGYKGRVPFGGIKPQLQFSNVYMLRGIK